MENQEALAAEQTQPARTASSVHQRCRACKTEIQPNKHGRPKKYCSDLECRRRRAAEWYLKNRKDNPRWTAKNKKIAAAWRQRSEAHISEYNSKRRTELRRHPERSRLAAK